VVKRNVKRYVTKRSSKYFARRVIVDGNKFHSKKEAKRYGELKILEKAGKITNLRLQVRYKIVVQSVYVADFVYDDLDRDSHIVEDAKGYRTREYLRKKKLMKAQHGIEILET
jgi:hypothetical protein